MKGVTPITQIKKWESEAELIDFCEHIISHSERYMPERVFEAKSILDSLPKQKAPAPSANGASTKRYV